MDKIYALTIFNETKALSTDKTNLEMFRDAYCVRDQVTPEDSEIIEYDIFSDTSYIKALPKPLWSTVLKKPDVFPSPGRMFAPMSNEEYAIMGMRKLGLDCELALIKQRRSSDPLAGLIEYHGAVAGPGPGPGICDIFVHDDTFYCRADNKSEAISKYMKFIKGKTDEQTNE